MLYAKLRKLLFVRMGAFRVQRRTVNTYTVETAVMMQSSRTDR
jgi:hypothetical protein